MTTINENPGVLYLMVGTIGKLFYQLSKFHLIKNNMFGYMQ